MSYEEFRRRIDTARQILVGAVPSPAGQIDQITYALMYKFMNDIDDQSAALGGKRTYFAGDYARYNWHELMKPGLEAHDQLELYRQAIQGMSKNPGLPPLFRDIYQNAFLPFNSPNVLRLFLEEVDKFTHGDSDDIGDAYEYLLSITGAQGDVGQFRTPRHIIKFIVEAVNPSKDDAVLDPAVGTAGFLIAAYNHVKSQHDGIDEQGKANDEMRLSADELEKLHHNYRGFDIDPTMVRTASVNLYLHNFASPDIRNHDSLSEENYWNDRYDVILANPPFMSPKGGIQPHKKFSISASRAEVLFVDYIASHLKPNGRAGIVVPEGIIFQNGKAYKELRKNLVENYLYAVVSLPAGVFQPYSGVKTSVLLFDKVLAKERNDILFVKVENDGYTLGAQRRRDILRDQLPQALEAINLYKTNYHQDTPFSHTVSRMEIAESGDYNLSGDRYKTATHIDSLDYPVVKLEDYVHYVRGITYSKNDEVSNGGLKVLRANNINLEGSLNLEDVKHVSDEVKVKSSQILHASDIFICAASGSKDHIGKVSYIESDTNYYFGGFMAVLRTGNGMNSKYLYYQLRANHFNDYLRRAINGVSINNLNAKILSNFEIPLPPIEIQREIAAELDGYQKIIDAAQTIVKTYKPAIKINPEWEAAELGDVFNMQNGRAFKSSEWKSAGMPIIRIANLNNEGAGYNYFEGEYDTKILVERGDLLFSWSGTRGTSFGPHLWMRQPGVLNQHIFRMLPKNNSLDLTFAHYYLKRIVPDIESKAHGSGGLVHITKSELSKFIIPIPPIEIQHEIVAEIENEQQLIDANKKLIEIYQQKIKAKIAEVWGE